MIVPQLIRLLPDAVQLAALVASAVLYTVHVVALVSTLRVEEPVNSTVLSVHDADPVHRPFVHTAIARIGNVNVNPVPFDVPAVTCRAV